MHFEEMKMRSGETAGVYLSAWNELDPSGPKDTRDLDEWCGARVLEEGAMVESPVIEQTSGFLEEKLLGKRVAAVDGSQVEPEKFFDIPIAVANCATVVNDYYAGNQDLETESRLLVPKGDGARKGDPYSGVGVKTERDLMEIRAAESALERGVDLVLLDNSLIPNFVNYRDDETRDRYVEAFASLLEASKRLETPLLGYVDDSRAADVLRLMRRLSGEERAPFMTDSSLLAGSIPEGGRTKAFFLERWDVGEESGRQPLQMEYEGAGYEGGLGFLYLDLGGELPKRIEFPLWLFQKGELDEAVDMVRAEAFRGERYPNVLLEAHDAAVVDRSEAERVRELMTKYVERRVSDKEMLKRRG